MDSLVERQEQSASDMEMLATIGDMGRKPDPTDLKRVAATVLRESATAITTLQSELLEQARIIGKSAEREERLAARVRELEALVGEVEAEILDLIVAITYADPPKAFNNILCHEARIPVEFIESARATLAKLEKRNADQ